MTNTNALLCFLFLLQHSSNLNKSGMEPGVSRPCCLRQQGEPTMGRYLLLWLLGIPIPILVLIWIIGGLH